MPLIDLACSNCLFLLEDQLVKQENMDIIRECPVCGKENTLTRLISISNFQMKGYSFNTGYSKYESKQKSNT
jgi:Zn finger protein HypA/HybF involved in hydrogenase expression